MQHKSLSYITKPVHFSGVHKTITPCGLSFSHSSVVHTENPELVTCKKCQKTHWVRNLIKDLEKKCQK